MQLKWPGKVHQGLHYAVEPPDFAGNHVHVAARIRIHLAQLLAQHLKMDNYGIDGVLDFMGYARSQPPNSRQPPRKFDLIFNAMDRFRVSQSEQCTDALSVLLDEVQHDLYAAAVFQLNL